MKLFRAWFCRLATAGVLVVATLFCQLSAAEEVAFAPAQGFFDWDRNAVAIGSGFRYAFFDLQSPRIAKLYALRVDLALPGISFVVTPRAEDHEWGTPMPDFPNAVVRTFRETTRDFMTRARAPKGEGGWNRNLVVAVNASPWTPWEKPFTHRYADSMGLVVSDGVLVSPALSHRPTFRVNRDGSMQIGTTSPDESFTQVAQAVSGFSITVQQGTVNPAANATALAPRTSIGLSEDHRYFYILVVDGRQENFSMGCTVAELGAAMRFLGAFDALEMDGGGSSTLLAFAPALDGRNVTPGIFKFNHQPNDGERKNGCHLGICVDNAGFPAQLQFHQSALPELPALPSLPELPALPEPPELPALPSLPEMPAFSL